LELQQQAAEQLRVNLLCGAAEEGEDQMLGEWRGGYGDGFRDWK